MANERLEHRGTPCDVEVWLCFEVWLFFWLMNTFNPYEYGERHKRNMASEEEAGFFSLTGSLWFTFTTLQWQGTYCAHAHQCS